jgi:4-amino-4-deoxy-L-arabinose transferase-like glycosyltransferase
MNIYAELDTNPSRRDLLSFGLIVAAGMGAAGAYYQLHLHRPGPALVFFAVGGAVFLLSWIPPIGRLLYILWMGFGLTLGFFTAPVLMFVVYAAVVVPMGLWFKLTKRDVMRRRLDPGAPSYWEDYPGPLDPASYIRQY